MCDVNKKRNSTSGKTLRAHCLHGSAKRFICCVPDSQNVEGGELKVQTKNNVSCCILSSMSMLLVPACGLIHLYSLRSTPKSKHVDTDHDWLVCVASFEPGTQEEHWYYKGMFNLVDVQKLSPSNSTAGTRLDIKSGGQFEYICIHTCICCDASSSWRFRLVGPLRCCWFVKFLGTTAWIWEGAMCFTNKDWRIEFCRLKNSPTNH